MNASKEDIRKQMAVRRRALSDLDVQKASERIIRTIQTLDTFRSAETIALYMAIQGEVNLETLFPICWQMGIRTGIPVFNANERNYDFSEITAESRYKTGHYGIREPVAPAGIRTDEIDLIIVPGVAFDLDGTRLGRGGGYYDRLLEGFDGKSVGVALDFQVLPAVPAEPHDRPVDLLVTETQIVKVS